MTAQMQARQGVRGFPQGVYFTYTTKENTAQRSIAPHIRRHSTDFKLSIILMRFISSPKIRFIPAAVSSDNNADNI